MEHLFQDRHDAGKALIEPVKAAVGHAKPLILALPRGGVPVAWEIAKALDADLDVLIVRKLGLPNHPELAMGALASGGIEVSNPEILHMSRISQDALAAVREREREEIQRRERCYRGDKAPPKLSGRTVVLVDDGVATGATMSAAIAAVYSQHPAHLIVAIPVAPDDAEARLRKRVDGWICLQTPAAFHAVGQWYRHFDQVTDEEVTTLLKRDHQH